MDRPVDDGGGLEPKRGAVGERTGQPLAILDVRDEAPTTGDLVDRPGADMPASVAVVTRVVVDDLVVEGEQGGRLGPAGDDAVAVDLERGEGS